MKVVNTKISVLDLNYFKQFLEHHKITGVFVGIHSIRKTVHQVDNYIQYVYNDDDVTMSELVTMTLKYGSLENAFLKARYTARERENLDLKMPDVL